LADDGLAPIRVQAEDRLRREEDVLQLDEFLAALGLDPLPGRSVARLEPAVALALLEMTVLAAAVLVAPVIAVLGLPEGLAAPLAVVELFPLSLAARRHGLGTIRVQADHGVGPGVPQLDVV